MILTKYVTDKYYSAIYSIENKLKSHRKDHSITTICFNSTRLTNMKYSNSSYYSFAHKRVQIENLAHLTCEIFMWTILCSLSPNRHRIHLPGGTRDNGRRSIPTRVFHTPNTICHSASRAVLVPVERRGSVQPVTGLFHGGLFHIRLYLLASIYSDYIPMTLPVVEHQCNDQYACDRYGKYANYETAAACIGFQLNGCSGSFCLWVYW